MWVSATILLIILITQTVLNVVLKSSLRIDFSWTTWKGTDLRLLSDTKITRPRKTNTIVLTCIYVAFCVGIENSKKKWSTVVLK